MPDRSSVAKGPGTRATPAWQPSSAPVSPLGRMAERTKATVLKARQPRSLKSHVAPAATLASLDGKQLSFTAAGSHRRWTRGAG
jgi:hypothetical protein